MVPACSTKSGSTSSATSRHPKAIGLVGSDAPTRRHPRWRHGRLGRRLATQRPGRRATEVTVYQRGWRLGGKGASSRGPNGRIEEHGLHVWLGFYDNAFRLLRSCYEELDRPRTDPACPIQGWRDAFVPASTIGLGPHRRDRFAALARPVSRERPAAGRGGRRRRAHRGRFPGTRAWRCSGASACRWILPRRLLPRVVLTSSPTHPALALRGVAPGAELLQGARTGLRAVAGSGVAARRSAELLELLVTMLRGIIADRLTVRGYTAIDHLDLRDWLARHGASRRCDRVADRARPLRPLLRVRGRRPGPTALPGRPRAPPDDADVPRLQGSAVLEDEGRNGRRGLRAAISGASPARRAIPLLPPPRSPPPLAGRAVGSRGQPRAAGRGVGRRIRSHSSGSGVCPCSPIGRICASSTPAMSCSATTSSPTGAAGATRGE